MNETVRVFCLIIGAVCGLILCAYPAVTHKRPDVPRWTYSLIALLGAFGACWAALGLTAFYSWTHFTGHTSRLFEHYKTLIGGVAIGLFLAWCVSGEFSRFLKRKPVVRTAD